MTFWLGPFHNILVVNSTYAADQNRIFQGAVVDDAVQVSSFFFTINICSGFFFLSVLFLSILSSLRDVQIHCKLIRYFKPIFF